MASDSQINIGPKSPLLPFSSLPLDLNGPPRNARGSFDETDHLGILHLLTALVIAAAAQKTFQKSRYLWIGPQIDSATRALADIAMVSC